METLAERPGLDDAISRLEAAEAAETQETPQEVPQAEPTPQQPVEAPDATNLKPDSLPTDTPAEADPKPSTEAQPKTDKPDAKGASSFKANAERLDKSWKNVNTLKADLAAKETALAQREAAFKRQEENFQLRQSKSSQRFTPQQYAEAAQINEQNASNLALQADGLDRRADQLESDGKLAEAALARQQAQEKRDEAATERGFAKRMKVEASKPQSIDATTQQIQARRVQEKQHYTLEAAKKWPDVAKAGSEFQKVMAGHLNEAAKQGINPDEFPIMMYHAARLTAAETAAASVPVMEKELGELRAKVKELEKLTSPGGGKPSAQSIPQKGPKNDEEEGESLRMEAASR